jgi:hypothetical protein
VKFALYVYLICEAVCEFLMASGVKFNYHINVNSTGIKKIIEVQSISVSSIESINPYNGLIMEF